MICQPTRRYSSPLLPQSVVHFWAPWCEPCKQMDTVLQHLAAEHAGVTFLRVRYLNNGLRPPSAHAGCRRWKPRSWRR